MFLILVSLLAVAAATPQNSLQGIDHGSVPSWGQTPFISSCSESDADTRKLGGVLSLTTFKEYILTMKLCGYEKKDIEVQVKNDLLILQAVKNPNTHILHVKELPQTIDPKSGKWLYDEGVLKIEFQLIKDKPSWSDVQSRMQEAVVYCK